MSSFEQDLLKYQSPLKYFALHLTNNDVEAEDLLQETLLKAITNQEKYTEHTNLKAWLYTIMRNIFINNYNRNIKTKTIIDSSDNLYILDSISVSESPKGESIINEQIIRQKINDLSDDYKIPFLMFFEGFKYKEIADKMDLPIGTVKSRIFLARKQLMKDLKELL